MKTAIIIVNYRTPWHLKLCLNSIFKFTEDFHLIVVQNSPDRKSRKLVKQYEERYPNTVTEIVNDKNLGFVGGVNSAYSVAIQYPRICLLNSDTIVTRHWLHELNSAMDDNPNLVQISPDSNSFYSQSKFWKYISKLPFGLKKLSKFEAYLNPPSAKDKHGYLPISNFWQFPGGFCNLFKSEYFKDLGYFCDPKIIHGYWDDFDLSYYIRQFGDVGSTNKSYVFHFLNVSFNKISEDKKGMKDKLMLLNSLYVMNKWRERLANDLNKLSIEELLNANDSYVVKAVIQYFGLSAVKPSINEYIESIPATEIGERFLK
jgi:O-antigen biosynthesis protein